MVKCLWKSSATCNKMQYSAQIVNVDGDVVLEVVLPVKSFFKRLKNACRYLFRGEAITCSTVLLDKDIKKISQSVDKGENKK